VARFMVGGWFVIKRGYAIFFLQRANGGRRRNRGG